MSKQDPHRFWVLAVAALAVLVGAGVTWVAGWHRETGGDKGDAPKRALMAAQAVTNKYCLEGPKCEISVTLATGSVWNALVQKTDEPGVCLDIDLDRYEATFHITDAGSSRDFRGVAVGACR